MKTFLIFIIVICYPHVILPENRDIMIQLKEKYCSSESGILSIIFNFWNDKVQPSGETLKFYLTIQEDSNITQKIIEDIKNVIDHSFRNFSEDLSDLEEVFPRKPIHSKRKIEHIGIDIQNMIETFYKNHYGAIQELRLSFSDGFIILTGSPVKFVIYNEDLWLESLKEIPNTDFYLKGKYESKPVDRILHENNYVVKQVDNLSNLFWDKHGSLKITNKSYRGSDYVDLNTEIFEKNLRQELELIAQDRVIDNLKNFFCRFLGNENTSFYEKIPLNGKEHYDFIPTPRNQSIDIHQNENYSLHRISISEKKHPEIDLPPFSHWLTTRNGKVKELFLSYRSKKYEIDISEPLTKIFNEQNGLKIYYDITRFFYGFTSALTIQDISLIRNFYHLMAIRSFYPGISDSRRSIRKNSKGRKNIVKGYKDLIQRGREVYVTLNEGEDYDSHFLSVETKTGDYAKKTLREISNNSELKLSFHNKAAFLLSIDMEQRWRTIRRDIQEKRLNDTARVKFNLLCLNMEELKNWLDKENYDPLTIFTLCSYLNDLWEDMLKIEKKKLEIKYPYLAEIIQEYRNIINKSLSDTSDVKLDQIFELMNSEISFHRALDNIKDFFSSEFRIEIHNRRFLFNVCYIKILYQYTYDNFKQPFIKPTNEYLLFN